MSTKRKKKLVIMMAVALASVLGLSHPTLAVAQEASEPAEPRGGLQTGIKVHGHWTIEVRNPDGTLVERREFQNALFTLGADALGTILGRAGAVGSWRVILEGAINAPGPCGVTNFPSLGCLIVESTSGFGASASTHKTLGLTTVAGKLTLIGTATATQDAQITRVLTQLQVCPNTVTPSSAPCNEGTFAPAAFTAATVAQDVRAGQIIQVTVAFSFS